jgi:hypothetical protein
MLCDSFFFFNRDCFLQFNLGFFSLFLLNLLASRLTQLFPLSLEFLFLSFYLGLSSGQFFFPNSTALK